MFKVNSKAAVRKLSRKSFAAAKSRNIIAVIAIALTALLFTALFTIGSGMAETIQRQTMRQAGGDGMGVLKYITEEEYEAVKDHKLIEEISYNRILCDEILNEELIKRRGEFYYMDDAAIKLGFCEPTGGHKPVAENEIMMDTKAAQMLGVELKEGTPVTLKLLVHGKEVERDFVLSGWWEADPLFNVSLMIASEAYRDAHLDELYNSYKDNSELTGVINSYIMFHSSANLMDKVERVITESGYSVDEGDPDYIAYNVNWSYLSTNFDIDGETLVILILAVLLIVFAGYLIIYNIFQISVIRDIRFYGLLKTIGTTGKQVRGIIRYQTFALSCMGIPIGLVLGYLLGCELVPAIMNQSYYAAGSYQVSFNPMICIGSALFALVTVFLSAAKPGRIAGRVSPVEAVRYTDHDKISMKRSASKKGKQGIAGMAAANMGRNRKKTVIVILSMTLSLVLFNTIYTLSLGFDEDKYVAKFVDTDFLAAHADYFNYNFIGPENEASESMIDAIMQQPGFEEGGRIYGNVRDKECFRVEYDQEANSKYEQRDDNGDYFCSIYGMEDLPLERLWVLEGEIDFEKLKSGDYILEGIDLDDHDNPRWDIGSHFEIGDKVTIHNYKGESEDIKERKYTTREFTVMAKVAIRNYTNSCGIAYEFSYYLPSEIYKEMVAEPGVMNYSFNIRDEDEEAMEAFMARYTEEVEPTMNYSSKGSRKKENAATQNMVLLVGGALSLVIGLIGVLNFVNSMLTSILSRRREFAMLQSVGMTTSQLRRMLMMEGLYYTVGAGMVSLILGVVFSKAVVPALTGGFWFFTYHFTLMPLLLTIPVLLVIGLLLPAVVLRNVTRQSLVERLREME